MGDPAKSVNRRLYYRQPMYLRIDLRVAGIRIAIPSTLIDISGGGCQIHARTMLKPRASVAFDLPRTGLADLRVGGVIKKVSYTPEDRLFRYAIQFDKLDARTRDELLRFVIAEQRRAISGVRAVQDAAINQLQHSAMRLRELRSAHRVEVNMPVRYTVGDSAPVYDATAIDIGTGGLRLIVDQVLRQEWTIAVRLTLPNETLKLVAQMRGSAAETMRPFSEMKLFARPLGGVSQSRGRYVQSLTFVNPDAYSIEEITRFVQAAKLTTLRR